MHRKIFAIGDSHSRRCFENNDWIADSRALVGYNKLDGKTAYNLERHEKKLLQILEPLREKELIFCFGEVDIRIHIKYKHQQSGVSVEQLIDKTAIRYISYVNRLRQQGYRIHVFNVVPTGDYQGAEAMKWKKGLAYPFTATYEERTDYTLKLNHCYRSYCHELQIPFVDIYQYLVDGRGQRRQELVFDFAHLNNQCAVLTLQHHHFPLVSSVQNEGEALNV